MAYRVTANTDDLNGTLPQAAGGSNQPILGMGWFMPESSLVALRYLCKVGTTPGFNVGTGSAGSESALRVVTSATTDWIFQTPTGVFTLNEWTFWAILGIMETATDTVSCRVWTGTLTTPPQEQTLTPTTGTGGIGTGGTSVFYAGIASSVSTAQLGIHDAQTQMSFGAVNTSGQSHHLSMDVNTSISDLSADLAYKKFILPHWGGNLCPHTHWGRDSNRYAIGNYYAGPVGLTVGLAIQSRGYLWNNGAPTLAISGTMAASDTHVRGPRAYTNMNITTPWVRR